MEKEFRLTDDKTSLTLISKLQANSNPKRHFHGWWELLYITRGKRTFFFENCSYYISEGSFLCVPPGVLHRSVNPNGETCSLVNLFFTNPPHPLQNLFSQCYEKFGPVIQIPSVDQYRCKKMYFDIGKEITEKKTGYDFMVIGMLSQFIVEVLRYENLGKERNLNRKKIDPSVSNIMKYVHDNLQNEIRLSQIARYVGLSESWVSRLFHKETGFFLIEYINGIRITKACQLLTTTNKSVTTICHEIGFGSVTQFGRCFKSFTGYAPLAYRLKNS